MNKSRKFIVPILLCLFTNTILNSFAQNTSNIFQIKIDTLYFTEIGNDNNSSKFQNFFIIRKTGDGENLALHHSNGEIVYFADPKTMKYQLPKFQNLPESFKSFTPTNLISYPTDDIRLWFNLYWILITDMKNNYKSHVISPFYTYREVFYRDCFDAEEFKINKNIIFSAHPMKDYDENHIYQKVSPLIPFNTVFALISLENILNKSAGDSLIMDDFITTSFCNANGGNGRATGGRNAGLIESENSIWFSDATMSNLISYSINNKKYKCYPLPKNPIYNAPEWHKLPELLTKETKDYNGIISKNPTDSINSVGLAWQNQWILTGNPNEIFRYWGIGSRSTELTTRLQDKALISGKNHNEYLNTYDYVLYQYLSLEPSVKPRLCNRI